MTDSIQSVADLLNQHIQKFQTRYELTMGSTAMLATDPDGQQIKIALKTGRSTNTKRSIR